jgi:soluble cytochrome b562
MNPTPPPAPTNGVAVLMAEIERIAQELRAYNKRPAPATEDQVKALVQLAERDRPLTLHVNSEAVAKQLVGQVEQQAKAFQAGCDKLITLVDDRTDYLTEQLTARLAAVQAAEAGLAATAQRIPREVGVNWLSHWKLTAGVVLGPLVLVLLMLWFTGMFSRVPQADFEKLQVENGQLRQYNARLTKEGTFYFDQVQRYRAKFPKTAPYFPKYVAPATPAPAAE